MDEPRNYGGVIVEPLDPSDFIAGANSPLVLERLNTTLIWDEFLAAGEKQAPGFETNSCVSQAAARMVTARLNLTLRAGIMQKEYPKAYAFFKANGYIKTDAQGREYFDISERFLAIISRTDPAKGNSGRNVCQALRDYGICPEVLCPDTGIANSQEWYTMPPGAVEMAAKSKDYVDIMWHVIQDYMGDEFLAQAPEMWFIPVCGGYASDDPIKACSQEIRHAVLRRRPNDPLKHIRDSYEPFDKNLAADYPTPYTFQAVVYLKPEQPVFPKPRYVFSRNINTGQRIPGERGRDVMELQARLGIQVTGVYDNNTRAAVFRFQLKNIINSPSTLREVIWLQGRSVGPKTRAALNTQ